MSKILRIVFSLRWMVFAASDNNNLIESQRTQTFPSYKQSEALYPSLISSKNDLTVLIERSFLRETKSNEGGIGDVKKRGKKLVKEHLSPSKFPKASEKTKGKVKCLSKTQSKKESKKKSKEKSKKKSKEKSHKNADCVAAYDCKNLTNREQDITLVAQSVSGELGIGSPGDLALEWLVHNDTMTDACSGLGPIQQRYSLAVFYFSTMGSDWRNSTLWLGPAYECTWYGVECKNGLVTSLFMDDNNLQGTLPTEVTALRSLSELHVYNNKIGGTIPTEIGLLTGMSFIDLEMNIFEGDLFFEELRNLNHTLQYLRGSDNNFEGTIPSWIGHFTGLHEFWAANNGLTGSMPSEIGRLTNLESWFIYNNGLNGTIPWTIRNLSNLVSIDLSSNKFDGPIPKSIGKLKKLKRLVMTKNHLSGSIPSSLGNLTTLMELYLNNNYLTGSLPLSVASLKHLSNLLLKDNSLTGSLTDFVSPQLSYVDLSNNAFGGSILSSFFRKPLLRKLYLSNNTFTGTIPSSFGDSTSLEVIWVDGNKLNGTIPEVPVPNGWPLMIEVLLDHNLLTGSVPSSICDLRVLNPTKFTTLHADCEPRSLVLGQAQNNCRNGCCTECFLGVLI